mgnify:CR=1 FL=1
MPKDKYFKLGELLITEGLITPSDLDKAIGYQRKEGGRLGEVLSKLGFITEEQIVRGVGKQLGIPFYSFSAGMLKPALDQKLDQFIPHEFAVKNFVLPLSHTLKSLTVAMADPLDLILIENLRKLTGCEINPVIATKSDILKSLDDFYGKSSMLKSAVNASYDKSGAEEPAAAAESLEEELSLDKLVARAEDAPVVKLVALILRQALNERASSRFARSRSSARSLALCRIRSLSSGVNSASRWLAVRRRSPLSSPAAPLVSRLVPQVETTRSGLALCSGVIILSFR